MTEFNYLTEGLKLAPSLAGALIIVFMFLRYLTNKEKQDSKDFDKRDSTIQIIATRAFEVHEKSNEVIGKNTEMMGQVKATLESVNRRLN